jgi:hypothetical protein
VRQGASPVSADILTGKYSVSNVVYMSPGLNYPFKKFQKDIFLILLLLFVLYLLAITILWLFGIISNPWDYIIPLFRKNSVEHFMFIK